MFNYQPLQQDGENPENQTPETRENQRRRVYSQVAKSCCVIIIVFTMTSLIMLFSPSMFEGLLRNLLPKQEPKTHVNICFTMRCNFIRNSFLHVWNNYKQLAFGHDDLKPISGKPQNWENNDNGIGLTIIDGLDTAIILGLSDVVEESLKFLRYNFTLNRDSYYSVFETNIRLLGGLLSAFDLIDNIEDKGLLLYRAEQVADVLLPAFFTHTKVPDTKVNFLTGDTENKGMGRVFSEFGSLTLEFTKLSLLTNKKIYKRLSDNIIDKIEKYCNEQGDDCGLYPIYYDNENDEFVSNQISIGALGDSSYEYFLKLFLLTGKTEPRLRILYDKFLEKLPELITIQNDHTFVVKKTDGRKESYMEHLTCFIIGVLVTGAEGSTEEKSKEQINLATELMKTCYKSYTNTKTGLGPETFDLNFNPIYSKNYLRPEMIEGLYFMYKYTGDKKYQDWGWNVFQKFEKYSKTKYGYSVLNDVRSENSQTDKTESFFLAETLKYLYLLFHDVDIFPINEFVFNTEAHPFRIH